jgi:hypothetical protein
VKQNDFSYFLHLYKKHKYSAASGFIPVFYKSLQTRMNQGFLIKDAKYRIPKKLMLQGV